MAAISASCFDACSLHYFFQHVVRYGVDLPVAALEVGVDDFLQLLDFSVAADASSALLGLLAVPVVDVRKVGLYAAGHYALLGLAVVGVCLRCVVHPLLHSVAHVAQWWR